MKIKSVFDRKEKLAKRTTSSCIPREIEKKKIIIMIIIIWYHQFRIVLYSQDILHMGVKAAVIQHSGTAPF